jgi:hypothetical protein
VVTGGKTRRAQAPQRARRLPRRNAITLPLAPSQQVSPAPPVPRGLGITGSASKLSRHDDAPDSQTNRLRFSEATKGLEVPGEGVEV